MAYKRGGLLAQIEADVVDDTVPLSSLLQKCIAIGGQAGSAKMRDWARGELHGYTEPETVPDYRHIPAALMVVITNRAGYNGITQRIDDSVFPAQLRDMISEKVDVEEAIVGGGIGELEALAKQNVDQHHLIPSWAGFVRDALNRFNMTPNSRVAEVYLSVPSASIQGLLVRVRTALVELVAELNALTPQDQDVPDQAAADQAVQFVVTGDRPTIQYGNTGNVAAGSSNFTQSYNAGFDVAKVREFADLAAEIVGLLGLDADQQAGLTEATTELHDAVNNSAADKGRMHRAVDAVMGYLKLASGKALAKAAITMGDQVGNDLDLWIRHHL
jgi:hypothetical protein